MLYAIQLKKNYVLDVTLTINTTIPLETCGGWFQFVNVESTTVTYIRPRVRQELTTWLVMHIYCSRDLLVSYSGVIATTDPADHAAVATLSWYTMSSHHFSSRTLEAVPAATGKVLIAWKRMSSTAPISAWLI